MFILFLLPILLSFAAEQSEEYTSSDEYELNLDYIIGDEDNFIEESSGRAASGAGAIQPGRALPPKKSTDKPPREVNVGVYIQRALWEVTEQIVNSHNEDKIMEFLKSQLTRAFNLANQNLGTLDNGGYKVKFNGTIQRLENSDVKIKKTYIDRLDGNKTKKFDEKSLFGHTFTFQEAVEKMPNRNDVHIRFLGVLGSEIVQPEMGAAEEHCICDLEWFGCVLVIGIRDPSDWARSSNLLTHEFGHSLGATHHDDDFYEEDRAESLLMWSKVDSSATVWSEKARKAIKEHDMSCLKEEKGDGKEKKKKKKE